MAINLDRHIAINLDKSNPKAMKPCVLGAMGLGLVPDNIHP